MNIGEMSQWYRSPEAQWSGSAVEQRSEDIAGQFNIDLFSNFNPYLNIYGISWLI